MAQLEIMENPDGEGWACSSCHEPDGEYSLKNEAVHVGNFGSHTRLPEDATYDDCLKCHLSARNESQEEQLVVAASELRPELHEAHLTGEHFEGSCFSCHETTGYAPESVSGETLDETGE